MSYLVLARKYRPHNFEGLVGQTHVVQALSNALTQQRLHHAYLFTGTRGVGKTTVSRILAKSLNCTGLDGRGGITASPCGVCSACRDIDAGRFVDYIELDAASNRGVEEISQLLDQAVYKPVVGRFKVYMIDEVHMLSNTAFNAMLKTLEEPPEYLKFVLATTDPQKVPPTVLSRCLQFNLRPMSPPTVQAHLAQVLNNETIAAEAGALRLLARAARGSMRDALSLTDQAIAFGAGHLTEDGVRQMLGAVDRSHCSGLLESLAASEGAALVQRCRALREQGIPAAGVLEELAELCQQIAVFQAVPDALSDETEDPLALEAVRRLSGQLPADELQLFYSMCLHGRTELHLAPDEHSALLMIMLRMLAFRTSAPAKAKALSATAPAHVAPISEALLQPPAVPAAPAEVVAQPVAAPVAPRAPTSAALRQTESHVVSVPPPARPVITNPQPARGHDDIPPWVDAPDAEMDSAPAGLPPEPATEPLPPPADLVSPQVAEVSDPAPQEAAEPPVASANEQLGDHWAGLVRDLIRAERISALVRELAWNAECTDWDTPPDSSLLRCVLRVEREMLRAPQHIEKLRAALSEHLSLTVELRVEGGPAQDTPSQRYLAEKQRRQQEAEKVIHEDPLVRAMLQQYSTARIVQGSIQPKNAN